MQPNHTRPERNDWNEERLRYSVLSLIYERTGASCEQTITGTDIGASLNLRFEDLFRVVHFLEFHGYLEYLDAGPRVCITAKGLRYVEELAGRRRSIRADSRWRERTLS